MANQSVVDELVVKLTLDAVGYRDTQHQIDININQTEKKEKDRDAKRKGRDRDQQTRWKSMATAAKGLGVQLAAVAGAVTAIGAGIVGSLSGLNTFELGLRRQAVATGLSNREMQAWGATAQRLGADAQAGQQAIADLAKEQKTFNLTGEGPNLQALARLGINVGPNVPIQDILAQAQARYRAAPTGQKQQIEAQLAAQNVSNDLILMIKSETDVRDTFNKSLQEATAENKKALTDFNDALASAKASAVSFANTLATVLGPTIQGAAKWLGEAAQTAARFGERVTAAGGGVDGFMKVLNEDTPKTAKALQALADVVDVVRLGFKKIGELIEELTGGKGSWLDKTSNKIDTEASKGSWFYGALKAVGDAGNKGDAWVRSLWGETVKTAHDEGFNSLSGGSAIPAPPARPQTNGTAQGVMGTLISKYGLSVQDAAAVTANLQSESGLNPAAYNPAGGGQGARGLGQWRGSRIDAFRAKYGINPDQATIDQQLEFMMTDPNERALLAKALATGNTQDRGRAISQYYEAHGNVAEDARRGTAAAALEAQYNAGNNGAAAGGPAVVITGPVSVQANRPEELVGGIVRQSGVTSYNTAVRN